MLNYDLFENEKLLTKTRYKETEFMPEDRHPFFTKPLSKEYADLGAKFVVALVLISLFGMVWL